MAHALLRHGACLTLCQAHALLRHEVRHDTMSYFASKTCHHALLAPMPYCACARLACPRLMSARMCLLRGQVITLNTHSIRVRQRKAVCRISKASQQSIVFYTFENQCITLGGVWHGGAGGPLVRPAAGARAPLL